MTFGYLLLALVLALTVNHPNRFVRAMGALIAAIGLFMIVISIVLADVDGTFTAFSEGASGLDLLKPLTLNVQAVGASIAIPFLLWAGWTQLRRPVVETLPLRNSTRAFGLVSRSLHWGMAVMILCLIPVGLFVAVLPKSSTDREAFSLSSSVAGLDGLRSGLPPVSVAQDKSGAGAGAVCWIDFLGALSGALDSGVPIP
jgi:hypothetical protein